MPADSIIEDIVARHDFGGPNASLTRVETRALIASWRERGEALRLIAEGQMVGYEAQTIARAALKDKP